MSSGAWRPREGGGAPSSREKGARGFSPVRCSTASRRWWTASTWMPPTSAASAAFAAGTITPA